MSDVEIVDLGASSLDPETAAERWQSTVPITDSEQDVEHFGELEVFQSLGISSLPFPRNDDGKAEAIVYRDIPGRSAVATGARDTRSKIAAGLKPGDTCLHSTGPEEAAQVRCIEAKRMVANVTKDSDDETMAVILDGKGDKFQVLARGSLIQIEENGDITLTNGKASVLLQGQDIYLNGSVHLAGIPPGMVLMAGPPSGSPGGPTSVPLFPVLGVGK